MNGPIYNFILSICKVRQKTNFEKLLKFYYYFFVKIFAQFQAHSENS